jgi:hypothetical protein
MVETEIEVPRTPSLLQRFSTEMLPERERFSAFREEFGRRVAAAAPVPIEMLANKTSARALDRCAADFISFNMNSS